MNKIYLIIAYLMFYLCIDICLANPQQSNWRWRNDDGDVYSATWKDSVNTPVVLTDYENIRLRIQNTYYDRESANISLRYTDDVYSNSWIPITRADTGKFFISPSPFLSDTGIYFDNSLLPVTDTLTTYRKTITFDFTEKYFLNPLSNSVYELEFSIKPSTKLKKNSAYFFSLFVDDYMYKEGIEYPVLVTSQLNWVTQPTSTIAFLYDVSFCDENNGIAVGGSYG